jgi:hypothetical protein
MTMGKVERLALAIHEADLGEKCPARGNERKKHIRAYMTAALLVQNHLDLGGLLDAVALQAVLEDIAPDKEPMIVRLMGWLLNVDGRPQGEPPLPPPSPIS